MGLHAAADLALPGGAGAEQSETQAGDFDFSQFQGRYIVHRRWAEEVTCEDAVRGRWIGTDEFGSAPGPNTTEKEPVVVEELSLEGFLDTDELPETGTPTIKTEVIDRGPCNEPAPEWWDGDIPPGSPSNPGMLGGGGKKDPDAFCAVGWGGANPTGWLAILFGIVLGRRLTRRRSRCAASSRYKKSESCAR